MENLMSMSLILLLIFNSFILKAASPFQFSQLKSELVKTTKSELMGWVQDFVKVSSPSRMIGQPGHDRAEIFITEKIKQLDLKNQGKLEILSSPVQVEKIKNFYLKDFQDKVEGKVPHYSQDYKKWFNFTQSMQNFAESKKDIPVKNIVWEKKGLESNKFFVITAHYDTISHDKKTLMVKENEPMPGANYNGSGVAVALGIIKNLAKIDLNTSVQVVFLDWQGLGFHGSEIYAEELKKSGKTILGVINLEMLGQDTSFLDRTKKTGNMSLYLNQSAQDLKLAQKMTELGKNFTQKVQFEIKPNGFENSDNFRFSQAGFSALTFSQNWEEDFNSQFYQTPQDTPETLNQETLWNSYLYISGGVGSLLLDLMK